MAVTGGVAVRTFGEVAEVSIDGGGYQVTMFEDLDIATVGVLTEATQDLWEQPIQVPLIIDLSGLKFIDSSGLLALIRLCRACRMVGRDVGLLRAPGRVDQIFKLTGMDLALPFLD